MDETQDGLDMRKGASFATLLGFVLALAAWMTLSPLFTLSARAELRNPATGQSLVCQASFAPAQMGTGDPLHAVEACHRACLAKGFRRVRGDWLGIDFVSPEAERRFLQRWRAFIPAACRT